MKIKAEVIADSKNEFGNRLTTMVVTFPRIILAEFNTHRMFSRNSASSRAIPFEKMVKSVNENPFIPIAWQKDHKGMQGVEYITDKTQLELNINAWLMAKNNAVSSAEYLNHAIHAEGNVTKQLCNRLLEPFMYHTVIVTASEYENFFALRCPRYRYATMLFRSRKDLIKWRNDNESMANPLEVNQWNDLFWLQQNEGQAEIHMMALAESMWDAYNESVPKELKAGEWHIPFGEHYNSEKATNILLKAGMDKENTNMLPIKVSTARCARVSYTVIANQTELEDFSYDRDVQLHDRLASSGHWSCFEHCAKSMSQEEYDCYTQTKYNPEKDSDHDISSGWDGNFRGFRQYRKMFNNENITKDEQ